MYLEVDEWDTEPIGKIMTLKEPPQEETSVFLTTNFYESLRDNLAGTLGRLSTPY